MADGQYDLIGPNGEIILPQAWEATIEPGWSITMHMWPIPHESSVPEQLSQHPPYDLDDGDLQDSPSLMPLKETPRPKVDSWTVRTQTQQHPRRANSGDAAVISHLVGRKALDVASAAARELLVADDELSEESKEDLEFGANFNTPNGTTSKINQDAEARMKKYRDWESMRTPPTRDWHPPKQYSIDLMTSGYPGPRPDNASIYHHTVWETRRFKRQNR